MKKHLLLTLVSLTAMFILARNRKIVLMIFLTFPFFVSAQSAEQFTVDTITTAVSKQLPFDRPFVLRITGNNAKSVFKGYIGEWVVNKGKRKPRLDHKGHYVFLQTIERENIFLRKNGVDLYINALPPNKNIFILLAHHFDGELLSKSLLLNYLIYSSDASANNRILELYDDVNDQIVPAYSMTRDQVNNVTFFASNWSTTPSLAPNNLINGYRRFYTERLSTHYQTIFGITVVNNFNNLTIANLRTLTAIIDGAKLLSPEASLLSSIISRGLIPQIILGTIPFDEELQKGSAGTHDLFKRISNIKKSIDACERFVQFLEALELRSNDATILAVRDDMGRLRGELIGVKDTIEQESEMIVEQIENDVNLTYTTWVFANNEIYDLKTKGEYQIIPDIGITTIAGIGNIRNEVIVRPYVGVSIYLRPVDKDVPFKYLSNSFLHRFSFNLGLTTGKIEKGEFSDLYGGTTLLTGINYKITREFAISMGNALMQRKNANPAIDSKQTVFNPYFGLSFDVDFTHTMQKLTSKLF